jgi:hypothetical protein
MQVHQAFPSLPRPESGGVPVSGHAGASHQRKAATSGGAAHQRCTAPVSDCNLLGPGCLSCSCVSLEVLLGMCILYF